MTEPDGNDVGLARRLLEALRPEPRPFRDFRKDLTEEDLKEPSQIYACLLRLQGAGLVDMVYGKGWYLLRQEQ